MHHMPIVFCKLEIDTINDFSTIMRIQISQEIVCVTWLKINIMTRYYGYLTRLNL